MDSCWLSCIFTFFLSLLFILFVIKNVTHFKLIDIPNGRSSHINPKPKGAGIGFFIAFIVGTMILDIDFFLLNITFFISIGLVFLIGLYDDISGAKPNLKFLVIILATVILFFTTDIKINSLGTWFGYRVELSILVSFFVTVFAVVGYTNALNLIDGLDGLAGGVSLVIFLSFLYLGYIHNDQFIIFVSMLMSSVLISFLFFNWYPSKIFMGDSGSLVLGFIISIIAIRLLEYINIVSVLFLASLPIIDTFMVLVRRLQRGLSPFSPDKSHVHHKLLKWKKKVDYTAMLIILIQLTFSLLGLLLAQQSNVLNVIIYAVILYLFFHIFDDRKIHRREQLISKHIGMSDFMIENKFSYLVLVMVLVVLYLVI